MLAATAALLRTEFDVVATLTSGEAAVQSTLELNPDVVVLDIAMPGVGGLGAARLIRDRGLHPKIVFLTSFVDHDTVVAAFSLGASAFVPKPRMGLDLISAIELVLAGRTFLPSYRAARACDRSAGDRHDLQIYGEDGHLVALLADNFTDALGRGDAIVAVLSAAHEPMIDAGLTSRGLDVADLRRTGRYRTLDAQSALDSTMRDGVPDAASFAAVVGPLVDEAAAAAIGSPRHVMMYGEIAPILCADGRFEAARRLEQLADEFVAPRPLSLLCGYSVACVRAAGEHVFATIAGAHAAVIPAEW